MLMWLANKYERSFKKKPPIRPYSADYYFRQTGRRTEIRRCRDHVLYMVVWDIEPTVEALSKACHLFPSQLNAEK
jgi:hypothetical protein